jgi:membrane-bound metal-dependent hydrolase YbcI (DUF457 family)
VNTYSHAFFTWALAKHGFKVPRRAAAGGTLGALLPDIPAFAGTAYYVGLPFLRDGWASMDSPEVLEAIYFAGPFGTSGTALHSAIPVGTLLVLYRLFGPRDAQRILLWFLLGWAGHVAVDFLTHVEDSRPVFWPLSDWEWSSPVSYWNPAYYGREFFLAEHGLILLTMSALLLRRLRNRLRRKPGPR